MDKIIVRGAREHNLKNIDVEIPRDKLVVITGLSGSGKSSLAFDTIYAEGQRRYVESLSTYARQFLELQKKPDCDQIEGLSPAISIDQKSSTRNPRSTVGTVTEIYDYIRLLFAKIGYPHCPKCGREVTRQNVSQMADAIGENYLGKKIMILAPVVRDRKGEHTHIIEKSKQDGFVRYRLDGALVSVAEEVQLDPKKKHTVEIVVDRLEVEAPPEDIKLKSGQNIKKADPTRIRLVDSLELALKLGEGIVVIQDMDSGKEEIFSEHFACIKCNVSLPEITPRSFSFNSPHGACPACHGLGTKLEIDEELVVPNKNLTLMEGALAPWANISSMSWYNQLLRSLAKEYKFSVDAPFKDLPPKAVEVIFYGSKKDILVEYEHGGSYATQFEGLINNLQRRYLETDSDSSRSNIEEYMKTTECPDCHGRRLKEEVLSVTINKKNIYEITILSIDGCLEFFENIKLTSVEQKISKMILKEVKERLKFLQNVGLNYLTLARSASTLSGGEAQRIRLATQIGSSLMGVLYVLDEPSIGLHQRDNARLIDALKRLRDLGNTVLVVEHDEEMIRSADHLIDIGPGAGRYGGEIIAQGTPEQVMKNENSLTGEYLSGKKTIETPEKRRKGNGKTLEIIGAAQHNLKKIDVKIPLGKFVGITGVSGSGKSSLINDILVKALSKKLHRAKTEPGQHKGIKGIQYVDKIISITQDPIGRTPRSNPATYTGVFTDIRELFAAMPDAKLRGYKAGRFSFNVKGGRCEDCKGDGTKRIEMHFLPDIYVTCETCQGQRYNREALEILYRGKNIAEVLDMTVYEALEFFENIPAVKRKLKTLQDVGLGYIHLGQSAVTLSGGEAQRIKLATELSRRATGKTMYVLDEPTTGLHFDDVKRLLKVLQRLVDKGNSVAVIEHNLDVVKSCDWLIDLGPEGGDKGGEIVAEGTPEQVAKTKKSYTGEFLKKMLKV